MSSDTLKDVTALISEELGITEDDIQADADIMKDLQADSLDITGLLGRVEARFHLVISEEEANQINTVQELSDFIDLNKKNR